MFDHWRDKFEDRYKKAVNEDSLKNFQEFLKKDNLPSKEQFLNALKKFSMRCIVDDTLDETMELSIYISRCDLWPSNYDTDFITNQFPAEIKIMHTLDLLKNLESEVDKENNQIAKTYA